MPEPRDAFARLLRDVDGLVPPRPEFAEALLARLLDELAGNPEDTAPSPPLSPTQSPSPPAANPQGGDRLESGSVRRSSRSFNVLATAALLLLTLVVTFLAIGPGRQTPRHQWAPTVIPAMSGTQVTAGTVITETLLDTTLDVLPAGHASIGVRDWTLRPSESALTMPPLGGPVFITVVAGAITVTVEGVDQQLTTGQHLALPGDTAASFRAAGAQEASIFEFYAVPSFTSAGRGLGETSVDVPTWAYDPVVYEVEYLITASPDGLLGGPSHLVVERRTLPPGSALSPQEAEPLTWIDVSEGVLGLTLEGEKLPFRWTSGDERMFRQGQKLPATQPGTRMILRNSGDDPLVLYRLTLTPSDAKGTATETPVS